MSFRGREMLNQIIRNVGGEKNLGPGVKKELERCLPNTPIVMNRAKRGIYAGRHIRFGNKVSEDGGNKTRRCWKPNVQYKRLFSYIHDNYIRVHVSTHALKCIDKAGGFDEYFLNTPYRKMDTELGLIWKSKIQKMYEEHGKMKVTFFSPEDETKLVEQFKEVKLDKKAALKEARRRINFWSDPEEGIKILSKLEDLEKKMKEEMEEKSADQTQEEGDSHGNSNEKMIAGA